MTVAVGAALIASRSRAPATTARARSRMYSALRVEYLSARSSRGRACASRAASGKAHTVSRPTRTGVPYRRTRRARHAKANERLICWAVIDPTSISNGVGARVGLRP